MIADIDTTIKVIGSLTLYVLLCIYVRLSVAPAPVVNCLKIFIGFLICETVSTGDMSGARRYLL